MQCTHCQTPVPARAINVNALVPCSSCKTPLRVDLFPAALVMDMPSDKAEALLVDHEAGCFYHPGKKAVISCDACGRFLCALCDVDMSGKHICFTCLESGKKKQKLVDLENHRTLYDGIAFRLAVWPLFIFYFTIITAPMSLFMVFRYWNAPPSLVRGSRLRLVLAGILSSLQIIAWSLGIYYLVTKV